MVLNTPVSPPLVEGLPEQHRDDRRDHDRQVGERAVEAAAAAHLAHQHGRDERDRVAEDAARAARSTRCSRPRSAAAGRRAPARKLSSPTQVAGCTRFVCCSDMITVRTIGYHENAPKISSRGSRKTTVVSPPPRTQVTGVRRAGGRVRAGCRPRGPRVVTLSATAMVEPPRVREGPPPAGCRSSDTRPMVLRRSGAGGDRLLCGRLRLPRAAAGCSRSASVSTASTAGVERVVDALRRGRGLGRDRAA